MSSYTSEQLTSLKSAVAQGVMEVQYSDKKVKYASINEMLKLISIIERELNPPPLSSTRKTGIFSKGLNV